jgi:hypothetical protein
MSQPVKAMMDGGPRRLLSLPRRPLRVLTSSVVAALVVAGLYAGAGLGSAVASTLVVNPSFETGWTSSTSATCWQIGGVGSGSATLSPSSTAHSGSLAAKLTITSLSSGGNRKVVIDQQSASCAPAVSIGHKYAVSAWYRSSAALLMVVYYRDSGGAWHWWAQSPRWGSSSSWRQMSFTTAAVPAGATALSFGPSLSSTGWMLVDDAAMADTSTAPTSSPTGTSTAPTSSPTGTSTAPTSSPTGTSTAPTSSPTDTSTAPTSSPTDTSTAPTSSPTGTSTAPTSSPTGTTVNVSTAAQLSAALSVASPGQTISLADGTYVGHFTLLHSGTAAAPIRITGSRNAHLDGGSMSGGYVLHLDQANYVQVDGITITDAQKAVVMDQCSHDVLTNLDAYHTGEEIILLRNYSSDNVVSGNEVHDSGHTTAGYGEGIYIGLAISNWSSSGQSRTNGGPDTSDRNQITGNHIYGTTAENIDIKEGTTGGLIANNSLDSTGMSGANYADSWVDLAGNDYLVRNNIGVHPSGVMNDGYQTHIQASGWAMNNTFTANTSAVNASGYAFNIQTSGGTTLGNVVKADNTETGAAKGMANIAITP